MSLPPPEDRPLLTAREVAESGVIPLGLTAIRQAIKRGDLPTAQLGSRTFIINSKLREQLGMTL